MSSPARPVACLALLAILAALAACAPTAPDQPAETPADHMREHFTSTEEVRMAVIHGDLDAARDAARRIALHERMADMPEGWGPHLEEMRNAASRVVDAADLAEAATAVGLMGNTCGECHRATSVLITVSTPTAPPAGKSIAEHMAGHQWAADRMWEGLIGPSPAAWATGAAELPHTVLLPQDMTETDALYGQLMALASRVHELGDEASASTGSQGRADTYGEFLATCAQCHSMLDTETAG